MDALNLKISNDKTHFKKGIETERFNSEEKKKLAKASKEFETMLTSMMIKSMTETTDGLFGKDNYGGDVLDVLFESEISKFITNSQGMGIADKIYGNMTGEELKKVKTISKEKNLNQIAEVEKKAEIKSSVKIKPNESALNRVQKYDHLIKAAADKFNLDEKLIKSVILTESAGKVDAKSKADAKGLMQLMDSTATEMGVENPWNAKENIFGGSKYLAKLLNQFDGDMDLALAAYNAGPTNVKKYNGIPPFKETENYIKRVNNYLNILE
jgi:Rod binding domain-containing protein